jgi:hypothetical protein
MVSIRGQ